jgi:hypothetical protein
MLQLLLVTLIGSLAAASGCAPGADGPFAIRLRLDTALGGCPSDQCGDFGMSCDVRVSVRIREADGGAVIASTCAPLPPAESLCGLSNLPAGSGVFFGLPARTLRIEVATWSKDVLDDDPELEGRCPDRDIFDLNGIPLTSFSPQPAFAGAAYFDAGSNAAEAIIPLACTDPVQLDTAECAPPLTLLATTVGDTERLREADDADAERLLVRAARPRLRLIEDEMVTIIDNSASWILEREEGEAAAFSSLVSEPIDGDICSLVLEQIPEATTAAVCAPQEGGAEALSLESALVRKPILDEILAAVGIVDFPEQGLVIGRVFHGSTGEPIAGVTLVPIGVPGPAVKYLDADRTGTSDSGTSENGYFIATAVPFGTTWAVVEGSGLIPTRPLSAGLIRGHLTVLMVPLE